MVEEKFVVKVGQRLKKSRSKKFVLNPVYFNVGLYLIVPLLLGVFLGYYLDKRFHSKPIFTLVGILLGTISTFYNLWKLLKEA